MNTAKELWDTGDTETAGRLIFESLARSERVPWASRTLAFALEASAVEHRAVKNALAITAQRSRWPEAHSAFDGVRDLVIQLGSQPKLEREDELLLSVCDLAELVAKVTYNETTPDDPFDDDSGWYIADALHSVSPYIQDPVFLSRAWQVLSSVSTLPE